MPRLEPLATAFQERMSLSERVAYEAKLGKRQAAFQEMGRRIHAKHMLKP